MKFETVKSVILVILVVISLSLTFGIWYYQPSYDLLYDEEDVSELDTDIGGDQNDYSDVIQPDDMIFHQYDSERHFGFEDPSDYLDLFNNMQSWSLSDFEEKDSGTVPKDNEQVVIHFPTELPMELIANMFSVDDDVTLPTDAFDEIYITFDANASLLNVTFPASDGEKAETAVIKDEDAYNRLAGYMNTKDNMQELIRFDPSKSNADRDAIYIPADSISMKQYSLTVDNTDPNKLVNALFSKPSLVNNAAGDSSFSDGQRKMDLVHDGKAVEFVHPYSDTFERMKVMDLIDGSIEKVNDHHGWTNDYYLSDMEQRANGVTYRMHYNGFPVYSYSDLSTIEQKWRDEELYKYKRPLFQLKNVLPQEDTKDLDAGEDVIETLTDNPNYKMENVQDLKIGYHLSYEDKASNSVTLKPEWYVNYDGNWREVNFDDDDTDEEKD